MKKYTNKTSFGYHKRQLDKPYESTKQLVKFISNFIENNDIKKILDIACGSGGNLIELSKFYKELEYVGVDISKDAINLGKNFISTNNFKNIELIEANLYSLENTINFKSDATLFIQTLFAMEDPFEALKIIIKYSGKFLFINSLFTYDDLFIKTKAIKLENQNEHYFNIIPIKTLQSFLEDFGGKIVKIEDVLMPLDIEKKGSSLGSYTKKLSNKERLVFTSDIYLPWKLIAIKFN